MSHLNCINRIYLARTSELRVSLCTFSMYPFLVLIGQTYQWIPSWRSRHPSVADTLLYLRSYTSLERINRQSFFNCKSTFIRPLHVTGCSRASTVLFCCIPVGTLSQTLTRTYQITRFFVLFSLSLVSIILASSLLLLQRPLLCMYRHYQYHIAVQFPAKPLVRVAYSLTLLS